MYFVLRPPWVKPDRIATYYALFPEVSTAAEPHSRWECCGKVIDAMPLLLLQLVCTGRAGERLADQHCRGGDGANTPA